MVPTSIAAKIPAENSDKLLKGIYGGYVGLASPLRFAVARFGNSVVIVSAPDKVRKERGQFTRAGQTSQKEFQHHESAESAI
jgi:hypothetical protein